MGRLRLALALGIFAAVTPPLMLVQAAIVAAGLGATAIPRRYHRLLIRLIGIRVHAVGRPAAERPLLIAANHVSWTDIVVLGSIMPVSFVAKAEVRRWPLFGQLARLQRTVFVRRDARREAGDQVAEIAKRLDAGEVLVLFPEGTSADGNRVLPFKSTLFSAVAGTGARVQPVAIAYTRLHGIPMGRALRPHAAWTGDQPLLPHLGRLLSTGGLDVEVHFGEPLPGEVDRKTLAREAERQVAAMMAQALARPLPPAR